MDSILFSERGVCFLCGRHMHTEVHHLFGGAMRKKSEKLGLKIHLCHACHNEPPNGAHHCKDTMDYLHKCGQKAAMQHYGWSIEDFRREFYKNHL